jgi:hypothetical protein
MARLSLTAKAGIILIAGPCLWLASWALWHYTRSWEPVDIPISLAPGHISTSIKIKFESDYAIYLGTREEDYVRVPCSGGSGECYLDLTMIQATWSVGSGGKVGVDGAGPVSARLMKSPSGWGAALGRFHADRGIYMLDLDFLNDLSALNPNEPYLRITEDGGRYEASIRRRDAALLCVFALVPMGLPMLILAAAARRSEEWCALTQPGPMPGTRVPGAPIKVSPRRKPKLVVARAFSVSGRFDINHQMLVLFLLLMLLWTVFVQVTPLTPYGLAIHAVPPNIKPALTAGIMPLRIHVLSGKISNYSAPIRGIQVGSQIIDRSDFPAFLRREIPKRPPDWPVYIEGDSDLEYQSVAWAIDAVSPFGAKVILLTPRFKADLGERSSGQR